MAWCSLLYLNIYTHTCIYTDMYIVVDITNLRMTESILEVKFKLKRHTFVWLLTVKYKEKQPFKVISLSLLLISNYIILSLFVFIHYINVLIRY